MLSTAYLLRAQELNFQFSQLAGDAAEDAEIEILGIALVDGLRQHGAGKGMEQVAHVREHRLERRLACRTQRK